MKPIMLALTIFLAPAAAQAQAAGDVPTGDVAAGESQFARQCVSCHVVVDDAGETLAGRNARTGPNLYGVAGRTPGAVEDFAYSDDLVAYGETGAVWDETNFAAYVQDPTAHLREALDDPSARSKMSYHVREEQDALDLWTYLVSLAPADAPAADE